MDSDRFWQLVDATAARAGDLEEQTELLRTELRRLDLPDLLAFDAEFTRASHALYTWEIMRGADIMIGDVSDDVFADFRSWVVSRGRSAYERVLADPDAGLAALDVSDEEEVGAGELFAAVIGEVYAERTGTEIYDAFPDRPSADFPDGEPAGPDVGRNRRERRAHFPRLAARHQPAGKLRFPWRD